MKFSRNVRLTLSAILAVCAIALVVVLGTQSNQDVGGLKVLGNAMINISTAVLILVFAVSAAAVFPDNSKVHTA